MHFTKLKVILRKSTCIFDFFKGILVNRYYFNKNLKVEKFDIIHCSLFEVKMKLGCSKN